MPSTFAKRSAAGGVAVWLIILLLATSDSPSTDLIHKIVLFAVLVIVPLGLSVVAPADQNGSSLYKPLVTCSLFAWSQISPRELGHKEAQRAEMV